MGTETAPSDPGRRSPHNVQDTRVSISRFSTYVTARAGCPGSESDRPSRPASVPEAPGKDAEVSGVKAKAVAANRPAPSAGTNVVPAPKKAQKLNSDAVPSLEPVVERPHRRIKISKRALDRRTGRSSDPSSPSVSLEPRELMHGQGYGICTCGQKFNGPPDIVTAAFAVHECGKDKGSDLDPVFDR